MCTPKMLYNVVFVCVVGDSIYPVVTRNTLKWWPQKIPSKYHFIEYRLNLSIHIVSFPSTPNNQQEAHGSHGSPEKPVQINEYI